MQLEDIFLHELRRVFYTARDDVKIPKQQFMVYRWGTMPSTCFQKKIGAHALKNQTTKIIWLINYFNEKLKKEKKKAP